MEDPMKSVLTQTERYASAALFAISLHQSQVQQSRPWHALSSLDDEPVGEGASLGGRTSVSDEPKLWIHDHSGLLCPILRFLEVDEQTWKGLTETAGSSSQVRHHVGSFLKLLVEDRDAVSSERRDKELSLAKTVDAMVLNIKSSEINPEDARSYNYEKECQEKYGDAITDVGSGKAAYNHGDSHSQAPEKSDDHSATIDPGSGIEEKPVEEGLSLSRHRKLTICYELISAFMDKECAENDEKSLGRKGYDARHRVALRHLSTWLGLKWIEMEALEMMVASSIMASEEGGNENKETTASGGMSDNWKRGAIIGAAALTGGTLMAITGGLAAPAIGQGLGALAPAMGSLIPAVGAGGFTAAATATGSAAGSVALAASFGAAGAGLSGSKMAKRIGELEEFEFKDIGCSNDQGWLAVEILISGLAFEVGDFVRPWEGHDRNLERYALQWESKNLVALSTAVQNWLTSKVAWQLMTGGAMLTVLSSLVMAVAVPASLVAAADLIDSEWAIGVDRADKAGILLGEVLLKTLQGKRPVTLIGFSLGARVIFKCLSYLAEAGEDCARLVERVVLLGAPIPIKDERWDIARKMVAGRFINAYSQSDWTLGIAFRASMLSRGLAGIQQVDRPGIENVDVSQYINGHSSYLWRTKQILNQLELDNPYPVFRADNTETQPKDSP